MILGDRMFQSIFYRLFEGVILQLDVMLLSITVTSKNFNNACNTE